MRGGMTIYINHNMVSVFTYYTCISVVWLVDNIRRHYWEASSCHNLFTTVTNSYMGAA